jgi:hypothetical protein
MDPMTFQDALDTVKAISLELAAIHFRRGHRGSCIRPACMDLMTAYSAALRAAREMIPQEYRPTAYSHGGNVFLDAETGAALDAGFEGVYVLYHVSRTSLMYTWTEPRARRKPDRCHACLRSE